MKTTYYPLFALVLSTVLLGACKKSIYGCTDPSAINYSSVANESSNDCIYENVKTSTLLNTVWNEGAYFYTIDISWTEITQEVLDNGTLTVHIQTVGSNEWTILPTTIYLSDTYSSSLTVNYELNKATITWTDSDLTSPGTPPNMNVKLTVVE